MQRRVAARLLFLVVLAILLAAMAVHYGATAPDRDPYAGTDDLVGDYRAHVGEEVYVWGRVVRAAPDAIVVRSGSLALTVETAATAAPGDVVQVYGTLRPDRRVDARRVVVSEREYMRSMYAISGVAGLLTAALFVRSWRIDPRSLSIRPRGDGDD